MKDKMLTRMHLTQFAKIRLNELQHFHQQLDRALENPPKQKMKIVKCTTSMCYYLRESSDPTGTYIRKKELPEYASYLQRHYDDRANEMVKQEIEGLRYYLDYVKDVEDQITNLYGSYPEDARPLIKPIDKENSICVAEWEKASFTQMPRNPDRHIFKTEKGEWVRSKSELNIANALYRAGIPYRYEARLSFGKKEDDLYPDFTIFDVKHMRVVYWEHRGMMDDMTYSRDAVKRIKYYMIHGIFLGDQLIITEETSKSPLTTDDIEMIIKHYFK